MHARQISKSAWKIGSRGMITEAHLTRDGSSRCERSRFLVRMRAQPIGRCDRWNIGNYPVGRRSPYVPVWPATSAAKIAASRLSTRAGPAGPMAPPLVTDSPTLMVRALSKESDTLDAGRLPGWRAWPLVIARPFRSFLRQ